MNSTYKITVDYFHLIEEQYGEDNAACGKDILKTQSTDSVC